MSSHEHLPRHQHGVLLNPFRFNSLYDREVLSDAPLGYWRGNQAAGATSLSDFSGNGRTLTTTDYALSNLSALFEDLQHCMEFDGSASVFRSGTGTPLLVLGDVTLECVVVLQRALNTSELKYLMTHAAAGETLATNLAYGLLIENVAGTINLGWMHEYSTGLDEKEVVAWTPTPNVPYHVAAVRDDTAKAITFYVDGVQQGSPQSYTNSAAGSTSGFFNLGASAANNANTFLGLGSNFAVYGSALDSTRIAAHYAALGDKLTPPVTYQSHILGQGPVAYWRFNEIATTTAQNIGVGAAYELTHTGTANDTGFGVDTGGPAKQYSSASSSRTTGAVNTVTHLLGDMTYECWIEWDSFPSDGNQAKIFSQAASGETEANNYLHQLSLLNTAGVYTLLWFHERGAGVNDGSAAGIAWSVTTGVRHHLVFTRNSATNALEAWVDGVSLGTTSYTDDATGGSNTALSIGREGGSVNSNYVNGKIDEPAIYNRVLTSMEIAANYAAGNP